MIDSKFIMRYTDALYSTPAEYAPRYDEFRDMFSCGQIKSKEWIIKQLSNIDKLHQNKSFAIAGAWFGTLGMMIKWKFTSSRVTMLDIDPRCEKYIHNLIYDNPGMKCITEDIYNYEYTEDVIINTSCEHIPDVQEWLNVLPKDKMVILQSNNFINGSGHINCVNSENEFLGQANLQTIYYIGKLDLPIYTRYMIIGKT